MIAWCHPCILARLRAKGCRVYTAAHVRVLEVWVIAEKEPHTSWNPDMQLDELRSTLELISTVMPQNRLPNLVAIERYDA